MKLFSFSLKFIAYKIKDFIMKNNGMNFERNEKVMKSNDNQKM
jgi:hypothetical protein